MKFFFDESGDFRIPKNKNEYKVGVVMGITISEIAEERLYKKFREFVSELSYNEFERGEPKGYLLTNENKIKFCELLFKSEGIQLTPVTLDLAPLSGSGYINLNDHMAESLRLQARRMKYKTMRDELLLLSRQVGNLSTVQALRIYSLSNCFREALHHAIIFLSEGKYEECWNNLKYVIDRYQVCENSREERIFSKLILAWLSGWSKEHPFLRIEEIHTQDHIIMKKYHLGYAFDIGALLIDKIYWKESSDFIGLQIADIASNIVYRASTELNDKNDSISIFASLMRSSHYGYKRGPGLFTPISLVPVSRAKFLPLIQAMEQKDDICREIKQKYLNMDS